MTEYIDGIPSDEIMDFKKNMFNRKPDFSSRKCEFCDKDLTGQTSKFTTDITTRIGINKTETKTIEYCSNCKRENNM